ncbi:MAG TPA: hypothetical protein VG839_09275 [Asticcacaulis sp.]|nr:hypothetical protein [Asticcacaulis sp.]
MPVETKSDVAIEKMVIGMNDLADLRPEDREQAFVSIYPAMTLLLRNAELHIAGANAAEAQLLAQYTQTAKIYLRALATYRAATDEWLKVFLVFKLSFDRNLPLLRAGVRKGDAAG